MRLSRRKKRIFREKRHNGRWLVAVAITASIILAVIVITESVV